MAILTRATLFSFVFAILCFGLASLGWPSYLAGLNEINLTSSLAHTEFRTIYGGVEIALAVYLIFLFKQNQIRPAMTLSLVIVAGFAFGRVFGIIIDGTFLTRHTFWAGLEIIYVGLFWFLLNKNSQTLS